MSSGIGVKVECDTAEFIEGENRITHFADHFEKKFMRKFSHAFGAAGLAIGAFNLIEGVFGKPEKWEELGKKFALSAEAVQLLEAYAKETGMSFEELWSKAMKGAVDLDKVLAEMRKKNVPTASNKNVEAINANRKAISGAVEGIETGLINAVGGAIRAVSNPENQAKMRDVMHATPGFGGPTAGNLAAKARIDEYQPMGGEEEEPDKSDFSHNEPGIEKLKKALGIKQQIEALEKQKKAIERQPKGEVMGGDLTGRQQVGAYTSQQGAVVEKIDAQTDVLHGIDDRIQDLKATLEKVMEDLK